MSGSSDGGADRPWQSYNTVYTNAKAGMDGVDKEKVQRIVYEMSKGSKYYENEQRKEAFIQQKIDQLHAQCAKLSESEISYFQMIADKRILELEARRDLSKIWVHVDMDAFYAAVETLENPSLKGKPLAVGSMSMICTANYEARRFGVRAAMPGFIACRLCPNLIFVPTNFKNYTYYSELTRKVFQKYDPNFIATSLDEAYLNITNVCKEGGLSGGEVQIAEEIRASVFEDTGLTCSAGVASNRLLAKVCSDINKPNGQFVLPNDRMAVMTFISSLPIRKIGGIGMVTESILRDVLGIKTCEDLLQKSAFLCALFSQCSAEFFLSVGLGLGNTDTPEPKLRKSMSSERSFSAIEDEKLLLQRLADIAENLSSDLQKEGLCGRTLTLKLKTASFEVRTRAVSVPRYICSRDDILNHATKLLKAELPLSIRLIGLRMSQFNDDQSGRTDPSQKTLTNFVILGDSALKVTGGNTSLGSANNDNHFSCVGPPPNGHQNCLTDSDNQCFIPHGSGSPMKSVHLSDLEHEFHAVDNAAVEMQRILKHLKQEEHPTQLAYVTQSHEMDDSSRQSGVNEMGEVKNIDSLSDNKVMPSCQEGEPFWIDDYKCSRCGIELPSTFIEERQEHSDYHLAEMLQKEESMHSSGDLMQQQRSIPRAQHAKESARKKQKFSAKDSKHLPIDLFFIKGHQCGISQVHQ